MKHDLSHVSFLLDTNVLLAATLDPERLPEETALTLRDPSTIIYFSAASIWEIGIKKSLGRNNFDFYPDDIHQLALETGFTELPVFAKHCYVIARLPWHHRDPFDRLLIAQAIDIRSYLVTTDSILPKYSDLVIHIKFK
ncbi:type II toxin-antitoxin system VapC family toxin [Desulfovermiculus halophilus]|jgi:PIN domain nuclease of toxin-antitoxin system|uniref:type II toxin-antitoxin system VapC family toxin n=1 Tax=Desulfovermiculus halophilus TaxID=339722 RepID=UPI000A0650C2|nr:type II toxin-antitoxin system VapC family toxin [Desulfovermiculus halophilus]